MLLKLFTVFLVSGNRNRRGQGQLLLHKPAAIVSQISVEDVSTYLLQNMTKNDIK